MSTVSNLNGGRLLPIVRDTASAIKQIKSDLQSISSAMDTIITKAGQMHSALSGGGMSLPVGRDPATGRFTSLGQGGTHANGMPRAPFSAGGNTFNVINNALPINANANPNNNTNDGGGGRSRRGLTTLAEGFGGAMLAGGFASSANAASTMYDQDTLYNRLRVLSGGSMHQQLNMARSLTSAYQNGFVSTQDRDAAVSMMLNMGISSSQIQNRGFANQLSTAANYGNLSLQQAVGLYQPLMNRGNLNMERALGIPVLNWQNGKTGNLDTVLASIASAGHLTPGMGTNAFNTAFSQSGQFRAFLQDLGYDNGQIGTLETFYKAAQKSGQPVNFNNPAYMKALGPNAQTLMSQARGRINANAQRQADMYGDQRTGIESANTSAQHLSEVFDTLYTKTHLLAQAFGKLSGASGGLSTLPGGGMSVFGNAVNTTAHSALDMFFMSKLLGGGKGAAAQGTLAKATLGAARNLGGGALAASGAIGLIHPGSMFNSVLSGAMAGGGLGAMSFTPFGMVAGALGGAAFGLGRGLLHDFGIGDGPGVDPGVKLTGGSQNTISQIMSMATGLGSNYRVTSGYRETGNPNSYHRLGEAVDFAEATPGTHDTPGLLRIDQFFADKYGSSLAELIYAGPGGVLIKDGKRVGPNVFGQQVMSQHHNHVHVALKPGAAAKLNLAHGGDAGSARASNTLAGAGLDSLTYTALSATNAAAQTADYFGLGTNLSARGVFAGGLSGGSGSSTGSPSTAGSGGSNPSPSKGRYSYSQLMGLAQGAGFSASQARIMAAIALAESSGNPGSLNNNARTGDLSYGLWQINMLGSMGPGRRKEFGIGSNDALFNAGTNAHAALDIFKDQGFNAWSTYKSGAYKQYLQTGDGPGAVSTQNAGVSAAPVTIAPQCNAVFNVNVQSASEAEAIRLAKMAAAHLKEETTKMMIGRS